MKQNCFDNIETIPTGERLILVIIFIFIFNPQAFQKDLGSHQRSVDSANESGDHLISDILDDPAVTKDDLQQLNDNWDELCQQSVDKQDRLDEARKAAEGFEKGLNDLVTWIDTQAKQLASQPDPSEDVSTLQQQIEDNKVMKCPGHL